MPKPNPQQYARVLSIDPCGGGFGFAVLEGEGRLLDWGIARLSSKKEAEFLVRLDRFVEKYRPFLLVCEELPKSRRKTLSARRLKALVAYADEFAIPVEMVGRRDVREAFLETGKTKDEIARRVAEEYPELVAHVPAPRKFWKPEALSMNIFDALSFILALPQARKRRAR